MKRFALLLTLSALCAQANLQNIAVGLEAKLHAVVTEDLGLNTVNFHYEGKTITAERPANYNAGRKVREIWRYVDQEGRTAFLEFVVEYPDGTIRREVKYARPPEVE